MFRPTQIEVAARMMEPGEGKSMVMQLNMGEGKSSVIVPLLAATLADCSRLVRVVVLKPLLRTAVDSLTYKLDGLLDRKIMVLPCCRDVNLSSTDVITMKELYEECVGDRGVVVTLPEYILSFKLMGLERVRAGDTQTASSLLALQKWLDLRARDVLDESDEILHVKYQLIIRWELSYL